MRIDVHLTNSARVEADLRGHRIVTDQPVKAGGENAAPAPFDLFLASIATCAGYFAQSFCQARGIDPTTVGISMEARRNPETHGLDRLQIDVDLPEDFPKKYEKALLRSIDQCSVKKVILEQPVIEVVAQRRVEDELAAVG